MSAPWPGGLAASICPWPLRFPRGGAHAWCLRPREYQALPSPRLFRTPALSQVRPPALLCSADGRRTADPRSSRRPALEQIRAASRPVWQVSPERLRPSPAPHRVSGKPRNWDPLLRPAGAERCFRPRIPPPPPSRPSCLGKSRAGPFSAASASDVSSNPRRSPFVPPPKGSLTGKPESFGLSF